MKFDDLYRNLERNKYYVFSLSDIIAFYPHEKKDVVKIMVDRWKKKGWIAALKKGLYELTYPGDRIIPDLAIAGRLYSPSYVSLETALSNFSLIPEVSMAVTSVTTKPTRRFRNKHGLFIYRTVKKSVFTGYYVERSNGYDYLLAEPEKALVDYLYFKTYRNKDFDIKDERIDRRAAEKLSKKKMDKYAKLYGINMKRFYAYL